MKHVRDDKFIVFKRAEWEAFWSDSPVLDEPPAPVEDAVVIRTGDVFAAPALHSYAASIAVAAKMGRNLDPQQHPEFANLQRIADYFHERAVEADGRYSKVPD